MKQFSLILLIAPVIFPVILAGYRNPGVRLRASSAAERDHQRPISSESKKEGVYSAVITDYGLFVFLVDIQVGTPPQTFRAMLDNAWHDLFLPSIKCKSESCPENSLYDSSKSKTYTPIGYPVSSSYFFNWEGYASSDTVYVAGLEVKNQVFGEATSVPGASWFDDVLDTSLGLARLPFERKQSTLKATGIWHNIVKQNLLQRNIFSIKLSKSPHSDGEIMFGGINKDLFEGSLMTLPVTHVTHVGENWNALVLNHGWQVAAHSFSFGPTIEYDFSGFTAVVATSVPYIQFPRQLGEDIFDLSGAKDDVWNFAIDCETRSELPDMVFRLGVDGDVTLNISPFDYISEVVDSNVDDGSTYCIFRLADDDVRDDIPHHIILGTPFLSGVYSVFDQDEATISFAQLKKI